VVIAGKNFGTGSSREHAPIAIKASGISCVIATSFARIFYRNAINIGLPVFECPELVEHSKMGDIIDVDIASGTFILNATTFQARPFPAIIHEILKVGGLVPFISRKTM
jgi:3-isopropylmalate/(R)-2-methylmalate dehydratase small subunit